MIIICSKILIFSIDWRTYSIKIDSSSKGQFKTSIKHYECIMITEADPDSSSIFLSIDFMLKVYFMLFMNSK